MFEITVGFGCGAVGSGSMRIVNALAGASGNIHRSGQFGFEKFLRLRRHLRRLSVGVSIRRLNIQLCLTSNVGLLRFLIRWLRG